jgi:phosphatidylethanolamine-binding protein (PEBP) family uncharacterized protein
VHGRRQRRSPRQGAAAVLSIAAVGSAIAGCGSGGGAASAGPRRSQIPFGSPSIVGNRASGKAPTIPARFTCDGANTLPPLTWGPVPPGTAELAVFIFKVQRSVPSSGNGSVAVSVEWAVTGLSPKLHTISAGKLPHGAIVAGKRYSICPAKGQAGTYIFQVSALSRRVAAPLHVKPLRLLQESEGSTVGSGLFTSTYRRA